MAGQYLWAAWRSATAIVDFRVWAIGWAVSRFREGTPAAARQHHLANAPLRGIVDQYFYSV